MDPNIILIALLAAPVIVLMFLRVNAALVFLSLCLGSVLVQFVGSDAAIIVSSTSIQHSSIPSSQEYVDLFLLLLPVVLTTVIMIRSVRGTLRLAYNLLPAVGVGALLALLAVPLLSASLTSSITTLQPWHELANLQTSIISGSALLALFSLWMMRPKHSSDGKDGK
jgi:asparagine N-glycosylation enzyme membrane subunit Stt3